jgi:hypothetical protein
MKETERNTARNKDKNHVRERQNAVCKTGVRKKAQKRKTECGSAYGGI